MTQRYSDTYLLADVPVRVTHQYAYLAEQCRDYRTHLDPVLSIEVTGEDLAAEVARAEDAEASLPYLESLALYRKLCECLVEDDVILFHCSAIAVDGVAYLFTAPSGTGKSTHTALWRAVLGERAMMVNDDKPLVRVREKDILVYGTPWDGKHRLSNRISCPIGGICLLARGEENRIKPVSPMDALPQLLAQTYRPENKGGMEKMLPLVIALATRVPVWQLHCNISEEAARLSYQTMSGGKTI